jgi:hypothetical protein
MFAGLQKIQRLKKDATEPSKVPDEVAQLGVFARRQMLGVLEGRIQVELKPNLNDPIRSIFDIEGIVVETDLARGNHVTQILFARECVLQNKGNGHAVLTILRHSQDGTPFTQE